MPIANVEHTDTNIVLPSVNVSSLDDYLNVNPFSNNSFFEVHKFFAAQMIMMEKQKQLLQVPNDKLNLCRSEAHSTKDMSVSRNDERAKHFTEKNGSLAMDANVIRKEHFNFGRHRKTFQHEFGEKETEDMKFSLEHAKCYLETKELWQKFHRLGTEMIITKTGR